jgi:2-amino-4-hydroxy-6-hydroxymethyldihydropteridine diphosphokinase
MGGDTSESGAARAYVGMGSNLGDRLTTLRAAAHALRDGFVPRTRLVGTSSIYETSPVGPSDAPYLNAVVVLRTRLSPRALLSSLQDLEAAHDRRRPYPGAARSLDLDLLLFVPFGAERSLWIDRLDLRLPHPELPHRDFVLAPLAELADGLPVHAGQNATTLLEALPASRRTILEQLDTPLLDAPV